MMQHPHSRASVIRILLVLALVVLGGAAGVVPGTARAASAQLKLSVYVAAPGANVTVTGSGFHAGDKASVSLQTASLGPNSLRRVYDASATVDGNGAISVQITVPDGTHPGFYTVVATDQHGNSAFQPLQVPIQVQVKAGQTGMKLYPVPGLVMQIAGTGFKAGETVQLSASFAQYNGNTVKVAKKASADSSGNFRALAFQIPWDSKDGSIPLTLTASGGTTTVTLQVAHRPFVILDATKVSSGDTLRAWITGFAPGLSLAIVTNVTRTDGAGVRLTKNVRTGGRGIAEVVLSLPRDTKGGSYVLTVTVVNTHFTAAARYSVTASTSTTGPTATPTPKSTPAPPHKVSLQVAPRAVVPGADAQVLGSGFPAGAQVVITTAISRNGAAPLGVRLTVRTTGKGTFVATLHTPGDAAAGTYRVTARGGGRLGNAPLHIVYLKTALVAVPSQAIPGTPVTVSGFGYAANSTVTVTLDGATLGTAKTDAGGAFKQQFTVPGSTSTGMHTLAGKDASGRSASFNLQVYRKIATHFYFASLFTGPGFQEYLLFTNGSETNAVVHITYQRRQGAPIYKTLSVPAHSRLTRTVSEDLGHNVTAAAVISADVPIAAERMVVHGADGALDPGAPSPATSWYFANGNTSHQYQEQIAVQNPTNAWTSVTLQVQPTHSKTYYLHGTMHPQSRMSWNLNATSHDAIGVIVTANHPVVANRTIFIHAGITSKTGVKHPATSWSFAAGPNRGGTRHWIGVINTTNQASHMVLRAYDSAGALVATVNKWLRPYDRQGFLMNQRAGQTEVAVTVTTTQPSIAEQSTFVSGSHDAHTDTFGVTNPGKMAQFATATTWGGQDNLLGLFNPNAVAIPVVVEFLNSHGGTSQRTYIVAPFAHAYVDIGKVVPNSQVGLEAVSSYSFVALDRQTLNNGSGAMITLGTQS